MDVSLIAQHLPPISDEEVERVLMKEVRKRHSVFRRVLETRRLYKWLSKAKEQSHNRMMKELAELIRGALVARGLAEPTTPLVFDRAGAIRPGGSATQVLARHPSDDLVRTIGDINTWSNNYMAEVLFKELGHEEGRAASWERAAPRITKTLAELGVEASELRVVNGSGLYRGTLLSTRAMVQLLVAMHREATLAKPFRQSLARPGRAGTLSGRLRGPASRDRV